MKGIRNIFLSKKNSKQRMATLTGKPSKAEITQNSIPGVLYTHEFDGKRFFKTVICDDDHHVIQVAPRTMIQVVYNPKKDKVNGIELVKVVNGVEKQRFSLSKFNIEQLRAFLHLLCSIDLQGVKERRYFLVDGKSSIFDLKTRQALEQLFSTEDGSGLIKTIT